MQIISKLKYPIGKASLPLNITERHLKDWIDIIEKHPSKLSHLVTELSKEQLDTVYRKDGWSIRQVIHHLGDSHTNSYIRFKWALTEDKPVIKAYYEERWAALADGKSAPIELSLHYLRALHAKWVYLLKSLTDAELSKTFIHPDGNKEVSLKKNIGLYAWHCEHHYEHINQLMIRKGWK